MNTLYYGDNLDILRRYIKDETVDLVYLDPPFKSNQERNIVGANCTCMLADTDILIPTSRPPGRKIEGELTKWPAYSKVTTAPTKSGVRA